VSALIGVKRFRRVRLRASFLDRADEVGAGDELHFVTGPLLRDLPM
jgi:hypothetical protein